MTNQPAIVRCARAFFRCLTALLLWSGLAVSSFGWTSGTEGFRVDTANRRDVLSFYHAVYGASEGFEARAEWTGDVGALLAGTTGQALKNDVLRRVNFYRALSGLAADLTLNAEKSAQAQEAALLAARNGGLSHYPAREHPEWAGVRQLPLGVEASAKSNLSLGAYGPAAVDGQIRDDGDANWQVGHRRWLLSPRQAEIGTGDVPGQPGFSAANAVWVGGEFRSAAPEQFVAWPNKGYTPANLVPKRWSVSHVGADFSGASVRMSRAGTPVQVRITCRSNTPADSVQGEQTLVWEPGGLAAVASGDVHYTVEVTGIRIGGEFRSLSYDVVAFDPSVLGETPSLTGAGSVSPAGGAYFFNSIGQADSYEVTVARGSAAAWMEGAEGQPAQVLTHTAPGYAVAQSQVACSGRSAFHLTHPGATSAGFADQLFQLGRRLVPGPESVLQFSETGRFAETTTTLNAEVSIDDGLTWTAVWSRCGVGLNSALFDAGWNPHAVSLREYSGRAVLVRFCLKSNGRPVAAGTTKEHGFFIDNILVTNGVELVDARVTTLAGTASGFELNGATAGAGLREGSSYYVSVAPRVGTRLFPSGPLKVVSVPVVSALAAAAAPTPAAPVIRIQPVEGRVAAGFPAIFSVGVAGGGEVRYQWRKDGVPIEGATAATYRIASARKSDEAYGIAAVGYDVVVKGEGGSVTSDRVGLIVVEGGAYIIENPAGSSVKLGESYTMRVTSADTEVTYQWRKNGAPISGGTGASFTLSGIKDTDAGRYDVVLRNAFGTVVSSPAYVGVASKLSPNLQTAPYQWTILAGSGLPGSANGMGLAAQFNMPTSIALHEGGTLYVSDTGNHVIRKVTQAGVVTTVAGLAGTSGSADGAALSIARFNFPQGIAVDKAGAVYIADPVNNTVRKVTNPGQSSASVSTVAGVAGEFGNSGGLNGPLKVALDPSGTLYVMDSLTIRKVEDRARFTLLFGEPLESYTGTRRPVPMALAVDSTGRIFAAASDDGGFKIFSGIAGGSFAVTKYGPYQVQMVDLALGAGSNLYAAVQDSVELLGDVSQSDPGAGLPVSLTVSVKDYALTSGLAVDAEGTIFAVDSVSNTVIKGEPTGLPVFVLQPAGDTGNTGVPLTLSAFATGPGEIAYQWYRDGVAIEGATGASYTIDSGGPRVGQYLVEASNAFGKVASRALGTTTPLEIVSQPQAQTVVSGASVALEVGWRGPLSTTFQWYKNGVAVNGATSAVYRFSEVSNNDAADYRVELKSGAVVKTSVVAKLTVNLPASIFSQPEDVAVKLDESSASLKVSATGTGPLTYQWSRNGVAIEGATGAEYSIPKVREGDLGVYTVAVKGIAGPTVVSNQATVALATPPSVTGQPPGTLAVRQGERATIVVSTAGSEPKVYQWRKDGRPIAGATTATLVLENAQEDDAGFYNVTVSNIQGSVTSSAAKLSVSLPAAIVSQPPPTITATVGGSVLLRVAVAGTGPFTYGWYRDGVALENGNAATYMAPTAEVGSAQYLVKVTGGGYGNTVESKGTTLTVTAARAISILHPPPVETTMIKGSAAFLKVVIDPKPADAVNTTYKLLTSSGTDTKIGGTVPLSGELEVPLKNLRAGGTYKVVFSRQYANKQVLGGVETPEFRVDQRTLERAVGTYELLLADSNGLVGDGAMYRGLLVASVTATGAVSGRLLYNEATSLQGAGDFEKAYTCVTRTFSSVFKATEADPDKLVCALNLGAGAQANRQAMELELDFSGTTVVLNALVRDRVSVAPGVDGEGCLSQGFGAVRVATNLTQVPVDGKSVNLNSLVGRYVLGSDFKLAQGEGIGRDNNATLLVQVLPTGKVVWASRLSGFAGSGSASLSTTDSAAATVQMYEGRTVSNNSVLSTQSLLGQLRFERGASGSPWSAGVSTVAGANKLERQACYVTKAKANNVPVYAGVQWLEFEHSCLWTGATTAGLLDFLKPAGTAANAPIPPLYLTAEDPAGEGTTGTFVWTIAVSGAGAVKATNYSAASPQPALTLRLDRTRGAWTGTFVSSKTKLTRTIAGVLVRPPDGDDLRGAGWVELGAAPATQTGRWELRWTRPETAP